MNLKLTLLSAALALAFPIANASRPSISLSPQAAGSQTDPFRWAPAAKAEKAEWQALRDNASAHFKSAPKTDADASLDAAESFSYLDMPDGSTWFVAHEFEKTIISQSEYYTDYDYVGIKATIYNDKYEKVGYIEAPIEKPEGYSRCANAQIGACVSKKFFNTNDNYEVMLMVNFNPSEGYGQVAKTLVFSLKGPDTAADLIQTFDGYYTVAINNAADAWSEDFFMEFFSGETYTDDAFFYNFDIYSKASYSSPTAVKLKSFNINMLYASSDGENETMPVMINSKGNTLYATVAHYEKTFFEDPFDFTNEKLNPDNRYLIDLYKKGPWETELALQSTTAINVLEPEPGYNMRSYALGMFNGYDDISFSFGDGETPAFVLSIVNSDIHENTYSYFDVVDTEGNILESFGHGNAGYLHLSSVKGQPEQYCFLMSTGEGDNDYEYQFYNWPEMQKVSSLPIMTKDGDKDILLSLSIDRGVSGNSYAYAAASVYGEETEHGDTFHRIAWFDNQGQFIRVDHLNAGKNVNLINPYVGGNALNPYVFNTDEAQEYMIFAKRQNPENPAQSNTEFMVVNNLDETLCQRVFNINDSQINVALVNLDSNPAIWVSYYDFDDKLTHTEFFKLPFNQFEGAGTADDPYLLKTQGDVERIRFNLSKNFRLANDIDFRGAEFENISGVFAGSIDGAGHEISNFTVTDKPIFSTLGNITTPSTFIRDLTLRNVNVNDAEALISEVSYATTFDNVRVINATVEGSPMEYGTLASRASQGTVITECAVKADINLPETDDLGGLVSTLGTDSKVVASSFKGSIVGASGVGGIAGSSSANASVHDCHVTADITAANTVGSIVGSSARSSITRCVAEGRITATQPKNVWSDYHGTSEPSINAGGIVGTLGTLPVEYDENGQPLRPDPNSPVVISDCFVALDAINIPDDPQLRATAHRIAGRTCINNDPQYLGEEYDEQLGDWVIIWGDPATAETKIENNFAISSLPAIDNETADAHNSTEGQSKDAADLDTEFFSALGYGFDGFTAGQPWKMRASGLPELHFETSLTQFMQFMPAAVSAAEGETVQTLLHLEDIDIESVTMSSSDEDNCFANLVSYNEDGDVVVDVTVNAAGTYTITATNGNVSALLTVTGTSGIGAVIAETSMTFDGNTVAAPGCEITVFSLDGNALAKGDSAVSVRSLQPGIYVAVARTADGKTRNLKIAVR